MVGRQGAVEGPVLRSNQTGEGGMEEGKLFVHFAPAWRMCRAIRRMLRGVGFNFITVKQTQARAIIQSLIKPDLQAPADSRNLSKSRKYNGQPSFVKGEILTSDGICQAGLPPPTGRDDVSALANRTCFGHEPQTHARERGAHKKGNATRAWRQG